MRELTISERQRIVEIFNSAMGKTSYLQRITVDDVSENQIYGGQKLLWLCETDQVEGPRERDPVFQIFSKNIPDRKNQDFSLYHFKKYDHCFEILENRKVSLNTLFSNRENDYAEFEEFFRRYGPISNLIPEDYTPPDPGNIPVIIAKHRMVDRVKQDQFIACFTQSYNDQRFWREYAKEHGLCFRLRFYGFRNDRIQQSLPVSRTVQDLYEFRDVCYDNDGYLYDFLNEINYKLGQELELALFSLGTPIAAIFYKRPRYIWEKEVRLSIDLPFVEARYAFPLRQRLDYLETPSRKALFMPIAEPQYCPFFGIELQDVFCSQFFPEVENVRQTLTTNFPNAKLWTFEEWSKKMPYTESIY